jgi:hypothetical protein
MSQRQAAAVLGVSHTTVQNDLANSLPEDGKEVATEAATDEPEGDEPDPDIETQ